MNVDPIGKDLVGNHDDKSSFLSRDGIVLLNTLRAGVQKVANSGTTAQRPVDPLLGEIYYDTTLLQLMFCAAVRAGAVPAVWSGIGVSWKTVELTGAGNWTPANGAGWYQMFGVAGGAAGGGHAAGNVNSGAGGGAAQEARGRWMYLDGSAVAYSVPGDAAGVTGNTTGTNGGDLTFGTIRLKGGLGGTGSGTRTGGQGGGPNAAVAAASGANGPPAVAEQDSETFSGAGGGGGAIGAANGGKGGPSTATDNAAAAVNDGTNASSGGGADSAWGKGGPSTAPVAGASASSDATGFGAGGAGTSGGTGNATSGKGKGGRLLIGYWG